MLNLEYTDFVGNNEKKQQHMSRPNPRTRVSCIQQFNTKTTREKKLYSSFLCKPDAINEKHLKTYI